jgi:type II secretory pathway pseudopilin PulG
MRASALNRFRRVRRGAQLGFTLVEAAVAMVIMGVAATMLWQTVGGTRQRENQTQAKLNLQRAEAAVQAFVAIHHRFPCPAATSDGLESCGGRPATGQLPHRTLGMPEAMNLRIRYTVDPVIAAGDSRFMVLVNDQAIGPGKDPRAVPVALKTLLTADYDGMLDVCESLSRIAAPGAIAYALEKMPDEALVAPFAALGQPSREVSAAQLSHRLGCGPLVAVAGRGQYNAHLAAAIMSKATQDHRVQSEVAYSLNHWNLSEGIWSFSNGMYSAMKNWAKLVQTSSALDANIWSNPGPFVALNAKALIDRTVEMVGVAARASNLARYVNNLKNAQDNRRAHHELVRNTLALYASTTRHALIGSTSAWFLREQQQAPGLPGNPGPATNYGVNAAAQAIAQAGQSRADTLGHGDMMSPYTQMPSGPDPEEAQDRRPAGDASSGQNGRQRPPPP